MLKNFLTYDELLQLLKNVRETTTCLSTVPVVQAYLSLRRAAAALRALLEEPTANSQSPAAEQSDG